MEKSEYDKVNCWKNYKSKSFEVFKYQRDKHKQTKRREKYCCKNGIASELIKSVRKRAEIFIPLGLREKICRVCEAADT